MKRIYRLSLVCIVSLLAFFSCSKDEKSNSETPDNPTSDSSTVDPVTPQNEITFAYGCDPSWVTPMEAENIKFRSVDGKETECFALLKSVGFNAARFRVWVNPETSGSNGMCDIDDVLSKCLRAKAQGMSIMIDFHYSDTWADPSKQYKPKAWDNIETVESLASQVITIQKRL
ncbi:MAG: glycosyl hydrolase 53 family protein [Bacteroidales bacterium]|nr:glycosyl hydrolase 53 family protein [Bacteroidales bacterium]